MPSQLIDSIFFKDLYGTDEMRAVFDDLSLLQRWLDVEVALAQAEAELGVIPQAAALEITRKARAENLDTARIKKLIDQTVHPIVPLIRVLAEACEGDAGEYIHWGATTQDIMDTANVLQMKQALTILARRLDTLLGVLTELAEQHRDTVMAGRTHGQQALPITLGFKVAVWIAELERHRERLRECQPRLLVGQFAGAVGTLASVAEQGLEIQQRMMQKLGLGVPPIAWHTARDNVAEFISILGMLAATIGKIAHAVILLQMTELDEIEEPFNEGKVGSSTMPHKRNPMICEAILGLTQLVVNTVPSALAAMAQEHERDWARQHMEWAFVPEACIMSDGALALLTRVGRGLQVNPARMARNLDELDGLMLSEAVMLRLAKKVGRQTAHEVVYACSMRAFEQGRPFRTTLAEHPVVTAHLSAPEIEQLLNPRHYTGLAGQFVDQVVQSVKEQNGQRNIKRQR
ncbi:MAG TPA: adenylosuccinate lyase [Anaerolineae bacterium]|nr:adenylosuccinate lyase [Anaerolineae bacterium]